MTLRFGRASRQDAPIPEDLWPSDEQRLLLDAALLSGDRAVRAYRTWRDALPTDHEFTPGVRRLLPLAYGNLLRLGSADASMDRLRIAYKRTWCETHQLFHRIHPTIDALASRGIHVLMLKGVPLVLSYYRSHGVRPMADVDVAVARRQLDDTIAILRSLGWRAAEEPNPDVICFRHSVAFIAPDGTQLDLHWRVLDESGPDAEGFFWSRVEGLDFIGTAVLQPDPTTLLFQVVVHGIRWNPEPPVRWIPDALTILRARGADIDWPSLVALATSLRLSNRVGRGLAYLADEFGAPVPADVVDRLRTSRTSLVERIENTTVMVDHRRTYDRSLLMRQWLLFTRYCRVADRSTALRFVGGFGRYARWKWGVNRRRDIVPAILRRIGRGLTEDGAAASRRVGLRP
jgi:hypothetical protein